MWSNFETSCYRKVGAKAKEFKKHLADYRWEPFEPVKQPFVFEWELHRHGFHIIGNCLVFDLGQ